MKKFTSSGKRAGKMKRRIVIVAKAGLFRCRGPERASGRRGRKGSAVIGSVGANKTGRERRLLPNSLFSSKPPRKSKRSCSSSFSPSSPQSPPSFTTMFNPTRSPLAWRSVQHAARGMATVAEGGRIGDTKVPMSLLEKNAYINYQRIEDNLAIVRDRCA